MGFRFLSGLGVICICTVSLGCFILLRELRRRRLRRQEREAEARRIEDVCPTVVCESDRQIDCVICWEVVLLGQGYRELSCGHAFHTQCIDGWWWQKKAENQAGLPCPICRR